MFTPADRDRVRSLLLDRAHADAGVTGAALVGSGGGGNMDGWSDIDLFLGIDDSVGVPAAMSEWTAWLYQELGALHHFDLSAGAASYRAFILVDLLEVDLGFIPAPRFGPLGPGPFRVVFGDSVQSAPEPEPIDPRQFVGLSWHHVLHSRSAIERESWWQALYWIGQLRDHTLALISLRHGQVVKYGKGADMLAPGATEASRGSLAASLDRDELLRALRAGTDAFVAELANVDADLASVLGPRLVELARQGG